MGDSVKDNITAHLKEHPTLIGINDEVTVLECKDEACGCHCYHCPFCDAEHYKPGNARNVQNHIEQKHFVHCVYLADRVIMKCCKNCAMAAGHYHCPMMDCADEIEERPAFIDHLHSHLAKLGYNEIELTEAVMNMPKQIMFNGYEMPLCAKGCKSSKGKWADHYHCLNCSYIHVMRVGLIRHMWQCLRMKYDPPEPGLPKQLLGLKWHVSIVRTMIDVPIELCTDDDCCKGRSYHCSLCSIKRFPPGGLSRIEMHSLQHWDSRVSFGPYSIVRCDLPCKAHANGRSSHYHCPICGDTRRSKRNIESHLKFCPADITDGQTLQAVNCVYNYTKGQDLHEVFKDVKDPSCPDLPLDVNMRDRRLPGAPYKREEADVKPNLTVEGFAIEACHKSCFPNVKVLVKSHYHCPDCNFKTILEKHLASHIRRCIIHKPKAILDVPLRNLPPKIKGLKWHLSNVRTVDDLPLERCMEDNCCSNKYHCCLCDVEKIKPVFRKRIEEHFQIHWSRRVSFGPYSMLHCYNKCDSTLRFSNRCHYHCPICGAVLQKTAHMRRQINSHLVECAQSIPDADLSAIVLTVLNFTEEKSDTQQVSEQQPDETSSVEPSESPRLQDSDDEDDLRDEMEYLAALSSDDDEPSAQCNQDGKKLNSLGDRKKKQEREEKEKISAAPDIFEVVNVKISQATVDVVSRRWNVRDILENIAEESDCTWMFSPGTDPNQESHAFSGSLDAVVKARKILTSKLEKSLQNDTNSIKENDTEEAVEDGDAEDSSMQQDMDTTGDDEAAYTPKQYRSSCTPRHKELCNSPGFQQLVKNIDSFNKGEKTLTNSAFTDSSNIQTLMKKMKESANSKSPKCNKIEVIVGKHKRKSKYDEDPLYRETGVDSGDSSVASIRRSKRKTSLNPKYIDGASEKLETKSRELEKKDLKRKPNIVKSPQKENAKKSKIVATNNVKLTETEDSQTKPKEGNGLCTPRRYSTRSIQKDFLALSGKKSKNKKDKGNTKGLVKSTMKSPGKQRKQIPLDISVTNDDEVVNLSTHNSPKKNDSINLDISNNQNNIKAALSPEKYGQVSNDNEEINNTKGFKTKFKDDSTLPAHYKCDTDNVNEVLCETFDSANILHHLASLQEDGSASLDESSNAKTNDVDKFLRLMTSSPVAIKMYSPKKGRFPRFRFKTQKSEIILDDTPQATDVESLVCKHCSLEGTSFEFISYHLSTEHSDHDLTRCDVCETVYATRSLLERHLDLGHFPSHFSRVQCLTCDETFFDALSYKRHMKKEHQVKQVKTLHCRWCEFSTTNALIFRQHKITNHKEDSNLTCHICNKKFAKAYRCNVHMKTVHSNESSIECSVCAKKFSHKRYLQAHMKRHTGIKKHECPTCGWKFYESNTLKDHMDTHKDPSERSYRHVCEYCGKKYQGKCNYKEHLNSHTKEKPYMCELCGKSFGYKSLLTKHSKMVHMTGHPFQCQFCEKSFKLSLQLTRHLVKHTGQSNYMCRDCNKAFSCSATLNKHRSRCRGYDNNGWAVKRGYNKAEPTAFIIENDSIDPSQTNYIILEQGTAVDGLEAVDLLPPQTSNDTTDVLYLCAECNIAFPEQALAEEHVITHHTVVAEEAEMAGEKADTLQEIPVHELEMITPTFEEP